MEREERRSWYRLLIVLGVLLIVINILSTLFSVTN
jgi:hypothetical protein